MPSHKGNFISFVIMNRASKAFGFLMLFLVFMTACSPPAGAVTRTPDLTSTSSTTPLSTNTAVVTATRELPTPTTTIEFTRTNTAVLPTSSATTQALPTGTPTIDPADWKSLPVIPTISEKTLEIYQAGQKLHNNPHAFSKVGDCETSSDFFLADFDLGPKAFELGPYDDLQTVIDYFKGSYSRKSMAAAVGYTASSAISFIMADPKVCRANETPLLCEYRINRPSFALIMFGTNDVNNSRAAFEANMRTIINISIKNGVVPVLATKADNLEGDMSINAVIARLANEYSIPLWNFWAAVQPLPNHGLEDDGAHLTFFPDDFTDPQALQFAFPVRNLTALQMLNALMVAVNQDAN